MEEKAANHAELRMVLAIRGDLDEMTRGKSEIQAAHAAFAAGVVLSRTHPDLVQRYLADGQPKIGVEVNDEMHLRAIIARAEKRGVQVSMIKDQGRTIFTGETVTCAIIGPMSKTDSNAVTRGTRMRDKER